MGTALRVLILEDVASDADLMVAELQRSRFEPVWERVEDEPGFSSALNHGPDVILGDFRLPGFDARRALKLLHERGLDIPFILVSGTIGEELAVSIMQEGASDYVMKDRMGRLGQAVTRALERKRLRDEQKRIADALRDSEERYRLLFESAPIPMWIYDYETLRYINVNEAAIREYGYSREEFLSLTLKDVCIEQEWGPLFEMLARTPNGNMGVWKHRKKDGACIDVEIIANFVTVSGRKVRIGLSHDITQRRQAEEALRQSEERFRATFEQAAVGIAHVSPDGLWLRVNQKLCDILGYPRDELVNRTFQSITHADNIAESNALRLKLLGGELQTAVTEKRYLRRDGSWLWAKATMSLVREASGGARYFITVIEDITARIEAERRILEQASLIDLANDAIVVHDLENRVQFWNRRAESLYGWTFAEARGRKVTDLIYPSDAGFEQAKQNLLEKENWHGEIIQVSKGGQKLTVDARWTLLRDEKGSPKSVLAINTDITEQKLLEQQFLRAQRLESIGTLASGIAHDLNNILAPILMSASMLREDLSPDLQQNIISTIEESAQRGSEIVKQVLTFTRGLQGDRLILQPRHLIREIEKIMQETFPKSITVSNKTPHDLWVVTGDPTQLHQVLLNLCINARDAMPDGGRLTIAAQNLELIEEHIAVLENAKPGNYVLIEVIDTGTGIPPEIIDKIFDPFFTTKEPGKGTGLGLSTVIGIVKSHSGFLHVESTANGGTTFKIFLPANPEGETVQQQPKTSSVPVGNGEVILVVDDEADIRKMLEAVLSRNGYKPVAAADGNEALRKFIFQGPVKLVLTDVMMPWVDGVVLSRALKKMDPDVKIIASTGQPELSRLQELKSLGVKGMLKKPFSSERLLRKIDAVLRGEYFEKDFTT